MVVQESVDESRWGSLPTDIASRLLEPRHGLKKSTLRLVSKHWRFSIDQTVGELTIDQWRLRRAGLNAATALSVAERQFQAVSFLRCHCPGGEDWLEQICSGPFQRIKNLTLGGDIAQQSFEYLTSCKQLRRLHVCSTHLDPQQFRHLSGITSLQTLDMKGSSINSNSISSFGRLSTLKVPLRSERSKRMRLCEVRF